MPGLGYSFAPTSDAAAEAKAGQTSPPFGSQGAIQTLNYRLPKVVGAPGSSALSPLVNDQRQGSGISSAVLESVLRTVLGPDHASMVLGASPTPQPFNERSDNGVQDFIRSLGGNPGGAPAPSIMPGGNPDGAPTRNFGGPVDSPAPSIHPGEGDTQYRGSADTPTFQGSPWAPGVIPTPGEGDIQHNPSFNADPNQGGYSAWSAGEKGMNTPDFGNWRMDKADRGL